MTPFFGEVVPRASLGGQQWARPVFPARMGPFCDLAAETTDFYLELIEKIFELIRVRTHKYRKMPLPRTKIGSSKFNTSP